MSEIQLNGRPTEVAAGTTVDAVVATITASGTGCAVAVNGAVVPRSDWSARALATGDRVEVLTAVQGG
jgi:sulfur carrier protein